MKHIQDYIQKGGNWEGKGLRGTKPVSMPLGGGGQFIHLFFMHFFYILQPLLLGYSLYRGAVYNALVLAVSSLRCPELPAFLARVAQNTAGPFSDWSRNGRGEAGTQSLWSSTQHRPL